MKIFKLYLVSLAAFLAIDLLWLGVVARSFTQQWLGHLLTPNVYWPVAFLFYLLFIAGVLFFVILPGLQAHSLRITLLKGAFFGLVAYGTYDLTNLATLKDWPALFSVVDLVWGTVLSTTVSAIGFLAGKKLK